MDSLAYDLRFAARSLLKNRGMAGVYGVVAYAVTLRTREVGIRMALGARLGALLRMVLGEWASTVGIGIVAGLGAAGALTRLMTSLLYDVGPRDPLTFACAAAFMAVVALAGSLIPALRAAHLSPVVALRRD